MPTHHLMTALMNVQKNSMHQALSLSQNSAKLAMKQKHTDAMSQIAELTSASTKRAIEMQSSWAKDWSDWMQYANSISGVNTIPKLAERSSNIMLQAQTQMVNQITDISELIENTMVSYSYWVSEKANDE